MKCTLREWQQIVKPIHTLIWNASHENEKDEWTPYPIGLHYSYVKTFISPEAFQLGPHDNVVISAFADDTDLVRKAPGHRRIYAETLRRNGILNERIPPEILQQYLPSFQFVISPEGNGIDCHRHYEALLAGCIPICEDHPLTREKYKGCPVLYTKDYSEITEEYLRNIYPTMLDQDYDFSALFITSYPPEIRRTIRDRMRYWIHIRVNDPVADELMSRMYAYV
jgi:hypothetical protein